MGPQGPQTLFIFRLHSQVLRKNEVRGSEAVGKFCNVDTARDLGESVKAYAGLLDCFVLEAEIYDTM